MANESIAEAQVERASSERGRPPVAVVPAWVLAATAVSAAVFTLGLLTASAGALDITYTAQETVLFVVLATIGRLVAVVVQAAVVGGAAGTVGKLRVTRRGLLVATFLGQVPLAIRDVLLGVLALAGVLEMSRVVTLALSPLDPFTLIAVWVFYRRARALELGDRRTLVQVVVAFAAYLYVLRLAIFAIGVVPGA